MCSKIYLQQQIATIVAFLFCTFPLMAKDVVVTSTASLSSQLSNDDMEITTTLTVTTEAETYVTTEDLTKINQMKSLQYLDLSAANFEITDKVRNTVNFPDKLIGNQTLISVKLPKNINSLTRPTFKDMPLLSEIYVPASLINVNYFTNNFINVPSLSNVIIDSKNPTMKNVGKFVVSGTQLVYYPCGAREERVIIPDGITTMPGRWAIVNNPYIKSIAFPASFNSLDTHTYLSSNTSCNYFDVADGNTVFGSMNGILTMRDDALGGKVMVLLPAAYTVPSEFIIDGSKVVGIGSGLLANKSNLIKLYITEGVKSIGGSAFKACSNLLFVDLPASITSMGPECFSSCSKMTQMIVRAMTAPTFQIYKETNMGNANFYQHNEKINVYVPYGFKDAYLNSWWNKNYNDGTYNNGTFGFVDTNFKEFAVETVSEFGYSSFYYGNLSLKVPSDVTVSTYKVRNGSLTPSVTYMEGNTIPSGTAVVLNANAGTYTFLQSDEAGTNDPENMLRGFDTDEETIGGGPYYKLSTKDGANVGFYYGATDGSAFVSKAHKAYLAMNGSSNTKSFYLFGEATDINGTSISQGNMKEGVMYNLSGQRVNKGYKGVVIMNNKKYILK